MAMLFISMSHVKTKLGVAPRVNTHSHTLYVIELHYERITFNNKNTW